MKPNELVGRLPKLQSEKAKPEEFQQSVIEDLRAIIRAQAEILRQMESYQNLSAKDGSVIVGQNTALQTSAKKGFLYIPKMGGATGPTTAPINYGGSNPIVFDPTNLRIWIFDFATAAWKSVIVA